METGNGRNRGHLGGPLSSFHGHDDIPSERQRRGMILPAIESDSPASWYRGRRRCAGPLATESRIRPLERAPDFLIDYRWGTEMYEDGRGL